MTQKRCLFLALTSCFCFFFGGCSEDPHLRKVTGTVTYQGKIVEGAAVQFHPVDDMGEPAAGMTEPNGCYVITAASAKGGGTGTKPGKYKVLVIKKEKLAPDPLFEKLNSREIDYLEYTKKVQERRTPPPNNKALKSLIPEKYALLDKTPLEFTVENKRLNPFDIELTD